MGGTHSDMLVQLLDNDVTLAQRLQKFDASKAKCFLSADRHHLLAVIEASFGDVIPFNKKITVSGVLELGGYRDPETGFLSMVRLSDANYG